MNKQLDLDELYRLLLDFFGNKMSMPLKNRRDQEIDCILYEAFIFKCGIDEPYNTFNGAIMLDSQHAILDYFGKEISLNNTREDIIKSFELVDKYCQLRLPDKYLEEFFKHKP